MRQALFALLTRDLTLAARSGGVSFTGALFFLILTGIVPFAIGPDQPIISRIAPAILWIGALLASLLALDRLFQADEEDGTLDIMMGAAIPLELIVAVKCLAHWLTTGLPLIVIAPLLGVLLGLDPERIPMLLLSLIVGTPALTALGAIGAALTVSLRRGGLLLAVLVLPLALPLLIFAVAIAASNDHGTSQRAAFFLLLALSLMISTFAPFAAAAALRLTRNS